MSVFDFDPWKFPEEESSTSPDDAKEAKSANSISQPQEISKISTPSSGSDGEPSLIVPDALHDKSYTGTPQEVNAFDEAFPWWVRGYIIPENQLKERVITLWTGIYICSN